MFGVLAYPPICSGDSKTLATLTGEPDWTVLLWRWQQAKVTDWDTAASGGQTCSSDIILKMRTVTLLACTCNMTSKTEL